jgi:hypothetical protein
MSESSRTLLYSITVTVIAAVALLYAAKNSSSVVQASSGGANAVPQATFNADAGSLGGIPDSAGCGPTPGTPRNVTFQASGLSGSVTNVDVSLTLGTPFHTWMGDVIATLIAPNGASHTLFGVTGSTTATGIGDSSDIAGPYVFSDTAPAPPSGGWWQESTARTATQAMTSGTYRTTGLGGAGQVNPAPPTSINASFSGVSNANGTWTLRFTDGCSGDTGAVSAASLSLTTGSVAPPADANVDFNGDGKTDYVVARGTSSPLTEATAPSLLSPRPSDPDVRRLPSQTRASVEGKSDLISPPIFWYTAINGSATTGVGQLGDAATDFVLSEDFDGDGKDDPVVWTEAAATQANFKILQSSTNTVRVEFFGQTGDDPAVLGDYDGDGKADPAVYRCPALADPAGQCFFFYRGSLNNPSGNVTFVPWGFGNDGDFFPYTGDFDGDGKNDFCVQRADPTNVSKGQFVLLKSNGGGVEYINWGLSSDFIIPGDYDGDGKTDFCVRRSNDPTAGARTYYVLTRTGSVFGAQWGLVGDSSTPGDYDGDGKTDFAIWRGSATPGDSRFWVLNSSNGSVTQFPWGQCPSAATCDFAVAGWAVH